MPKKLSKEEFISKGRSVHGDKYGYSKVKYTNNCTKVIITCFEHGDFKQTPNKHLDGKGCSKCSGNYKPTTEEFIEKSKSVWSGSTFDYSKVIYINNQTKITLICKNHNIEFKQLPTSHLQGCISCPQCLMERKGQHKRGYWTYERCYEVAKRYKWVSDFMKQDKKCYEACIRNNWHKDFTWLKRCYDYDEDIITCQKHCIYKYEFPQCNSVYIGLTIDMDRRHRKHINEGSVHNFCKANNLDIPKPKIVESGLTVEKSKDREQYWIDYYKGQGHFLINKVRGGSVGTLGKIKSGKETDEFIRKAKQVHGDKYDYSKVEYVNNQTKVIITCIDHGEFRQTPHNHLQGQGCPICGNAKISMKKTKWVYEKCKEESEKHKTRNSFRLKSRGAYEVSRINGWLDEFFPKK